mgnify:CR=1 FL=1
MNKSDILFYKVSINLKTKFKTAFHIGSGMEGEADSDHGILKDHLNMPFLPGSSLKGILRTTIEKIIGALQAEEPWACGLQNGLYNKNKKCVNGETDNKGIFKKANEEYQSSNGDNTALIYENLCSVCEIFGSQLSSSKVFIDDAHLRNTDDFVLSKRDGVGIDRDAGVSVDGVKYDYETANPGLEYEINIEAENVTTKQLGVLSVGILEWQHSGIRIGGKTSRGIGHASIEEIAVDTVDLNNIEQRKNYLIEGKKHRVKNAEKFLQDHVDNLIANLKE